jgi:hypothetical protein
VLANEWKPVKVLSLPIGYRIETNRSGLFLQNVLLKGEGIKKKDSKVVTPNS